MYNDEPTTFTPQQIAGMFFSKMRDLVQVSTGQKGCDMVISVPPYYTDAQRHAVLDACKIGVSAPVHSLTVSGSSFWSRGGQRFCAAAPMAAQRCIGRR
jgi:hypothetical protein